MILGFWDSLMRTSHYFLCTAKEAPADAEIISHQLMLRAGLIRKLAAGLYSWLPLGLRVLRKVEKIVREEMNSAGALELLMPAVQPAELWKESGRWDKYGPLLLKIIDHNDREFCFGPTHEEVITDIARRDIHSYKQLPINFYQIQTKFRDEIRPRFGLMRAREFIMKDAYSFHLDKKSLEETYQKTYVAYSRIFERLGLAFRAVSADTGNIGGSASHEFQVLAAAGEDVIAHSDSSEYAANIELAEALAPPTGEGTPSGEPLAIVDTPNQRTIEAVVKFLKLPVTKTIKTLIVKGKNKPLVALILRGDHQLNPVKAQKIAEVADPLTFASTEEIIAQLHCEPGSLGPIGLDIPVIIDRSAACLVDFCCGANKNDKHYINANWSEETPALAVADLRFVIEGDPSPDGKGKLLFTRGIEVGHIFQLGDKYSVSMQATVTNEAGANIPMQMGCYGIGISRIVAAAIEQHHDAKGIVWPAALAPFQVALIPVNANKSPLVRETCDKLYDELMKAKIDVLYDDRDERPGVMFADMELIGIPHRIVVGERNLANQQIEYQGRKEESSQLIAIAQIKNFMETVLGKSG